MKRNKTMRHVTIGMLTVSAFALTGCNEEEGRVFPSLSACVSAAQNDLGDDLTQEACQDSYEASREVYLDSAPRYDSMGLCEEQHGAACTSEVRPDGTSVFMPMMMGYMMGSALSSDKDRRHYSYTPVYPLRTGGYATASGAMLRSNYGKTTVSSGGFARPASTAKAAPMTTATVRSTGGFGAGRTGGSFGG